jgi:ribose transport system ATP-binding protein
MSDNILEMNHISKSFFGNTVLDDVTFSVRRGEVHCLLGENGAGKSTLMKILSGAYVCESGEIILDGEKLEHNSPSKSIEAGISVIYQELNMLPDLPVYENVFVGKEFTKGIVFDRKRQIEETRKYLDIIGLKVDPRVPVSQLSIAQQQMLEIAKAISNNCKVLVLDEPTASITDKEVRILFDIVRDLKKKGLGIIYISHRMAELFEIGDRVTVLRDGKFIGTREIREVTEADLTKMMVGREVSFDKIQNLARTNETVMEVRDLCYRNRVKNVSFDLHKGEILGFSGLVGSGRTEIAKCIIGAYRHTGSIKYRGEEMPRNVADTIKRGVVYLSEDRKGEGLVLIHTLADNIALPNLDKVATPLVNKKKIRSVAEEYIRKLKVKAFSAYMEANNLSGGNQQKVVIAKWLYSDADVFIFDEPTRGIDVGARDEIYEIMLDLVKQGKSIILISSDLVEVIRMSDRIAVMKEGVLSAVLENDDSITQEKVLSYAF